MSAFHSLRMTLKPPVAFSLPAPGSILSDEDVRRIAERGFGRERTICLVWSLYCRCVLSQTDPCMEPGEGAEAVITHLRPNDCICVEHAGAGCYILRQSGKELYLEETGAGGLMLYFLPPERYYNRTDECRVDLSDYGPEAAALFIAAAFGSYGMVRRYFLKKWCNNLESQTYIL